ncbi:hypothetical protein JG688_00008496 [Phytophthora aleatoria]|uniref:Crinkler effector protein N-terminal domain-containing protein n=1 Tax=Phytophthora aleatoria TaxID=2496075 RepID=A0A8J5J7Y9_9STRA|nr:hypothetical protein JG688_00008496 [Phytophthora aleatoria]
MVVSLFCVLTGVRGRSFLVHINVKKSVAALKEAIKVKIPSTITCEPHELQLFLAKKDGKWLESSSEDAKKLKEGETTAVIEALTQKDHELLDESGLLNLFTGIPAFITFTCW